MTSEAQPEGSALPDPAALLRAARGFSAAFWGLVVTILILTGVISVRPLTLLRLPTYAVGAGFLLLAAVWFLRAGLSSARWRHLARHFALAAGLQLYMIPFIGWWRTIQDPVYYSANIALLLAGVIWLLVLVHLLALEVARILRDSVLLIETRICLWACPLLAGVALGLFALGSILVIGPDRADIAWVLHSIPLWSRPWSGLPAALPFTVALAVTWEAKERCLAHLQSAGTGPKRETGSERA